MSSETLKALVSDLEDAMTEILDSEMERVTSEVDFLTAVLEGRGSAGIEDLSTDLTTLYLSDSLSGYIPIGES